MFSPQTVTLFESLLNNYNLPSTHPEFGQVAQMILNARNELAVYKEKQAQEPASENATLAENVDEPGQDEQDSSN